MGRIVKYECNKCRCSTERLFVGESIFSPEKNYVCFECLDCHKIMSKDIDHGQPPHPGEVHCKFCDGTNLIYWEGTCPRCGNKMDCRIIAFWD